ncbi:MAG: acetyl esterase [Actinomycetota bacterium]|jgi:acetyl esterase
MPLDPRIEAALALLPTEVDRSRSAADRRAEARARGEAGAGLLSAIVPPLAEERDELVPTAAGGVPVRIYRPSEGLLPALVYIHGGGWWLGTLDETNGLCRRRAVAAECVVVSVDYRLAPEYPFPAAVEDCWAATRWVFEHADRLSIDPSRVAIGGGSAGGNLAAAMTLLAREDPDVSLVAQLLEVPATDLTLTAGRGSIDEFASGYFLTRDDLMECVEFYLGDHDPTDQLASPLLADLHDLPRALVTTAEFDPVRDDGEAYAAKLAAAGVPVTLERGAGLVHGAAELDGLLPDVAAAYRELVTTFLRSAFKTEATSPSTSGAVAD